MSLNDEKYVLFVKNNKYLTDCQKKEFLNTPINVFYADINSDKQIITYIVNSKKIPIN